MTVGNSSLFLASWSLPPGTKVRFSQLEIQHWSVITNTQRQMKDFVAPFPFRFPPPAIPYPRFAPLYIDRHGPLSQKDWTWDHAMPY